MTAGRLQVSESGGCPTRWTRYILATVSILLAFIALGSTSEEALAGACPTMQVVGVRGSGETNQNAGGFGATVKKVVDYVIRKNPTAAGHPIDYEAVGMPAHPSDYRRSLDTGYDALQSFIRSFVGGRCGNQTYLYLVGYSQGAHVVGDVYQGHAPSRFKLTKHERSRIVGVALIGDPRFRGSQSGPVNVGNYSGNLTGINQLRGDDSRLIANSQVGQVRSYCIGGDPVCNYTVPSLAGCLWVDFRGDKCAHARYRDKAVPGSSKSYAETAADFLISRWNSVGPSQPHTTNGGRVLVFGRDHDVPGRSVTLVSHLQQAGYKVDQQDDLPPNLSRYSQVWWYGLGLTNDEVSSLKAYARSGRGLYLTSEWSNCCTTPSNSSRAIEIANSVVVTVGGLQLASDICSGGDTTYANNVVSGGITRLPHRIETHVGSCVGTFSTNNIPNDSVVFSRGVGGTRQASMLSFNDVVGGGRLVITGDINWVDPLANYGLTDRARNTVENIASFLDGTRRRVGASQPLARSVGVPERLAEPEETEVETPTSSLSPSGKPGEQVVQQRRALTESESTIFGSISGRVSSVSGAALMAICARAIDDTGAEVALDLSDSSGEYEIPDLTPGSYRIEFSDCGENDVAGEFFDNKSTLAAAVSVYVSAGTESSGKNAVLSPAGSIAGTVTNLADGALGNVCVFAYDASGEVKGSGLAESDGDYLVEGLSPGDYRVEFVDCGGHGVRTVWFDGKTDQASATPVTVEYGETSDSVNARMGQGGSISGTVRGTSSNPLEGVCVTAYTESGEVAGIARTMANGGYLIGALDGGYKLGFSSCGGPEVVGEYYNNKFTPGDAQTIVVNMSGSVTGIDAELVSSGSISGRVSSESGAGLSAICARAIDNGDAELAFDLSDSSGDYEISDLPPGSYRVEFSDCGENGVAGEYFDNKSTLAAATSISVSAGGESSGKNAVLSPSGSIAGKVTNLADGPIGNACVFAYDVNGVVKGSASTESNGDYLVEGLAPGDYRIEFVDCEDGESQSEFFEDATDFDSATIVEVVSGQQTAGVDASIAVGGTIAGLVTRGDGTPLGDMCVTIFDGEGKWFDAAITGSDGRYRIERLPAGEYTAHFKDCGGNDVGSAYYPTGSDPSDAETITIGVDTTREDIDVTVAGPASISGVITDSLSNHLQNICVSAYDALGNVESFAYTDQNGRYKFSAIDPGNYRLHFYDCWGDTFGGEFYDDKPTLALADSVHVAPGVALTGIDAELVRTGTISGVVTDSSSDPLAGVCVSAHDSDGNIVSNAYTNAGGSYTLPGLDAGDYRLYFQDCGGNRVESEFYDNKPNFASANLVSIAADAEVTGINAELQLLGSISGRVTNSSANPLWNICVRAYDSGGNYKSDFYTDSDGHYEVTGLVAGQYRIRFSDCGGNEVEGEFYDDKPDLASANLVQVNAGASTTEINAQLATDDFVPPNDDLANAQALGGTLPISITGRNSNATSEAGEPNHSGFSGGTSVWYSFTPTVSRQVKLLTCSSEALPVSAVYTGTSIGNLVNQGSFEFCEDFTGTGVVFQAVAGTTYLIAVDSFSGSTGTFNLQMSDGSAPGTHTLTALKSGTGQGRISSAPAGIDCGFVCTSAFSTGTQVSLEAVSNAGSTFVGWSGGGCSGTGICQLDMVSDRTVTASFMDGSDTTPPDTVISSGPSGTVATSSVTFEFAGNPANDTAKVQCRIDGGDFADCVSPKTFSGLANGSHTVEFRAEDAAGNQDQSPASRTFTVNSNSVPDTTPPDTVISSGPSGTVKTDTVTFVFAGSPANDTAKVQCRIDGADFTDCVSPKTFAGLSDGSHTAEFRAEDSSGNQDQSAASRTFVVDTTVPSDTTPPDTVILSGPSGTVATSSVTFEFAGNPANDTAKVQCRIDGGAFADCVSPTTFSGLADGAHTVEFRAEDAAGNQDPTPASGTFTVNTEVSPEPKARLGKVTVAGPAKVKKGKKAIYKVKVTNSGNAKASSVALKVNGKGIAARSRVGLLGAGKSRTVKATFKPKKPGKIKVTFKVTSANAGSRTVIKTITVKK